MERGFPSRGRKRKNGIWEEGIERQLILEGGSLVVEVLELDLDNGALENISRTQEFEESNALQVNVN